MAKVKKISDNQYTYYCLCGKSILLESNVPLKRLVKCFDCQVGIIEDDKSSLSYEKLFGSDQKAPGAQFTPNARGKVKLGVK